MTEAAPTMVHRAYAPHQPAWQRYLENPPEAVDNKAVAAQPKANNIQYSHVYHERLQALKPRCWQTMPPDVTKVQRLLELSEHAGDETVGVVGTLIVVVPSSGDNNNKPEVFLEDDSGRVAVEESGVDNAFLCTGLIVGLVGRVEADSGVFCVQQWFPPALPEPAVAPESLSTNNMTEQSSPHVLLVSGLECGRMDASSPSLRRDLLLSYMEGRLEGTSTGDAAPANICRMVVAGGLVASNTTTDDDSTVKGQGNMKASLQELDAFLLQAAAAGVPLDVMVGASDPTTATWPQRPLHSSLIPASTRYFGLMAGEQEDNDANSPRRWMWRAPNPYAAWHSESRYVVGTDGSHLADLIENSVSTTASSRDAKKDEKDESAPKKNKLTELEALEQTLRYSHLCPTGPDSVPMRVPTEQDVMVLQSQPSLYFCGNANKFDTKVVDGTDGSKIRLVCIPKFSETGVAVLVNLETLGIQVLRFE